MGCSGLKNRKVFITVICHMQRTQLYYKAYCASPKTFILNLALIWRCFTCHYSPFSISSSIITMLGILTLTPGCTNHHPMLHMPVQSCYMSAILMDRVLIVFFNYKGLVLSFVIYLDTHLILISYHLLDWRLVFRSDYMYSYTK